MQKKVSYVGGTQLPQYMKCQYYPDTLCNNQSRKVELRLMERYRLNRAYWISG